MQPCGRVTVTAFKILVVLVFHLPPVVLVYQHTNFIQRWHFLGFRPHLRFSSLDSTPFAARPISWGGPFHGFRSIHDGWQVPVTNSAEIIHPVSNVYECFLGEAMS